MPRSINQARDAEICLAYLSGLTVKECAERFKLTRLRIRQILHKAGVFRSSRVDSNRDEFLGIMISQDDKQRLRAEAAKRGLTMSSLTIDLIKDMLASLPSGEVHDG